MGWQACVSAERSCCGLKDNHFPLNHDYGGKSKITMNIKCQHLSNPHFCLLLTQRTSPPTSSNSGHLLWVNSLVTWSRWLVCVMNGNKLNEILATWLITQGWGRLQFLQVSNEKGDPGSLLERWGDENLLNYMSIISFQPWNKDSVIETNQDSMESNGPRFFFFAVAQMGGWVVCRNTWRFFRLELHVSSHEKERISHLCKMVSCRRTC